MGTKQFDNYADLITFTRASGATYLDSDGVLKTASTNIPRIEYDADGNRLGLLVEEQRTNLLTYSSEFDNADWGKFGGAVIIADQAASPDGEINADQFYGSSGAHVIDDVSASAGTSYTASLFVKSNGTDQIDLNINYRESSAVSINYFGARFDLSTETVTNPTPGFGLAADSATLQNIGGGWYRIAVSKLAPVNTTVARFYLRGNTASTVSDGFFIYGAQLEAGSFPTSYIPTSGSTATRAADSASITGADFKKWFNADEGTLVVEAAGLRPDSQLNSLYHISDGTIANRFAAYSGTAFHFYVVANGATQVNIDAGTGAQGVYSKYAQSYAINDFAAVIDGGSVGTDSSGILPNVSQIVLSGGSTTSDVNSNYIKSIKYYPRRLTNAQLQELTQ